MQMSDAWGSEQKVENWQLIYHHNSLSKGKKLLIISFGVM